MHYSSRYAALRAAAEGTYGFPACVISLRAGERSVADAIVALFADARVALAAEDAAALPEPLPSNIVTFPRADFLAGALPLAWLEGLSSQRETDVADASPSRPSAVRSDATRRLRLVAPSAQPASRLPATDAHALLADEIAWYRASGIGFSVAALSLPDEDQFAASAALREALRSADHVTVDGNRCIVVLAGEPPERAQRIVKRALAVMRKRLGLPTRAAVHSVMAACPYDGDDATTLLDRLRR